MDTTPKDTTEVKPKKVKTFSPTPLQRRVAQHIGEVVRGTRKVKTTKELLVGAGVAKATADHGIAFTKQKGMIVALNELGLTKEKVVPMLLTDLEQNPGKRWLGLSIAGKWLGLEHREEDKPNTMNIQGSQIIIQLPKGYDKDSTTTA